jgi:hypothetical protein
MPMNPRILRPLARPLLLDAVPGAAAAYSLRQLSNAYTGPVVTVRRSSDNAEADFKASEIDDGTLAAFCGAGDGLVKTWHDQSGNGRDASQGTAANQPKIVSSGSLVTEGGKAALEFDGTDDSFDIGALGISGSQDRSVFGCLKPDAAATGEWFRQGNTLTPGGVYSLTAEYALRVNSGNVVWGSGASGGKDISTTIFAGSTVTDAVQYINGVVVPVVSFTERAIATEDAGNRINSGLLSVKFHELIIYPSDQTANRERIEGDINRHFGIF